MTHVAVVGESALLDGCDRLVVSPVFGKLSVDLPTSYTVEGEFVRRGDSVATVRADGRDVEVCAPCDGWVMGYLNRNGARVEPGSAIVHLRAV
jgi:biotin carboxyl carrier protein